MAEDPQKTDTNRLSNGRFAPGNIANPGGRPKGRSTAAILRKLYDAANELEPDKSNHEVVMEKVVAMALNGERWAIDFIADRTEGKPVQHNINENTELPVVRGFCVE